LFIKKLQIENFRNLEAVNIEPHPTLNVIYGDNGAGKTSILESLVVLSRGRSFRTTQAGELIGPKKGSFLVYAETVRNNSSVQHIGLERSGKHWRARRNSKDLTQLSQLTRSLPVIIMEPNSHLLVSGPPEVRRKYIDWGMFHVEHEFLDTWRSFSKILKQRNAALRFRKTDVLDSLDEVFSELGVRLDEFRRNHVESIKEKIPGLLIQLSSGLEKVGLDYEKGWSSEALRDSLRVGREKDLERGMTGSGPHRADIALKYKNYAAKNIMSRGEQKVLSAALLLTQSEILSGLGEKPIILLDDLSSEFDEEHFNRVLEWTREGGAQIWFSGTKRHKIIGEHKVFHVERGSAQEML